MIILNSDMTAAAGDWYNWELCPIGTYAIGFNVKVDNNNIDTTGLNTVKLICNDTIRTTVDSFDGSRGVWGSDVYCPNQKKIVGFMYKYDSYAGPTLFIDDSSGNSIYFYCEDNTEIRPTIQGPAGSWTPVKKCPVNYAICGIMVQYQSDQGSGDDTALNNVKFKCCSL